MSAKGECAKMSKACIATNHELFRGLIALSRRPSIDEDVEMIITKTRE